MTPRSASDLVSLINRSPVIHGQIWYESHRRGLTLNEQLLLLAHQPWPAAETSGPAMTVAMLIAAGADVHAQDEWGRTPLHLAAHQDRAMVVRELLTFGANVNAETHDPRRWTPLHGALACHAWDCVGPLVDAGADLEREEAAYGRRPLQFAAESSFRGRDLVGAWLAQGVNARVHDHHGNTPLHAAARHGTLDNVRRLIAADAPVNATNQDGGTPLLAAATQGREDVVLVLLDAGANPFAVSHRGVTVDAQARLDHATGFLQRLAAAKAQWMANEQAVLNEAIGTPAPSPSSPSPSSPRTRL